jgi:hypothetical protein
MRSPPAVGEEQPTRSARVRARACGWLFRSALARVRQPG